MEERANLCFSSVLIFSNDQKIIQILSLVLTQKKLNFKASNYINDITLDYCLIIVGPDMDFSQVFMRLKQLRGITPHILILEKDKPCYYLPYFSCKCKKVQLPMGILQIDKHIDEVIFKIYS